MLKFVGKFTKHVCMMNFRTSVELPKIEAEIRHSDHLMLWGSCFTENIGNKLTENKFICDVNPFGVLYNPYSISCALKQVLNRKVYNEGDLFEAEGIWHSWMHHSSFSSDVSSDDCLQKINNRLQEASDFLSTADWLIITWGTAYVYRYEEIVVGNCHKCAENMFIRERLSVEAICEEWSATLQLMKCYFPKLKVLFSVSPIRHAKDGMHENQLSKAVLLLSMDELCRKFDNCYYFPSYEILMDELRDYRFYADDMLHPSSLAVQYIWDCFCRVYFKKGTMAVMKEWSDIKKSLQHKPFRPKSEAYRKFLSQIMLKIERLNEKFPYIDTQKEIEQCQILLNL